MTRAFLVKYFMANSPKVVVPPDFIFCTVAILSIICTILSVYGMKEVTTSTCSSRRFKTTLLVAFVRVIVSSGPMRL